MEVSGIDTLKSTWCGPIQYLLSFRQRYIASVDIRPGL